MIVVPQDPSVLTTWEVVDVVEAFEVVVEVDLTEDVVVGFAVDVDGLTLLVEDDFVEDFEDEIELELPHVPPTG